MDKILFLGDFFYDYDFVSNDIENISQFIKKNNYYCILNLEGALVSTNEKNKKRGPNLFHSYITIDVLKKLNVVGVTLANNHTMDYGELGLRKTIEILKEAGIKYCGAGENLKTAIEPMIIEINKKKICIYNYGWNVEETVYAKKNRYGCAPKIEKYIYNKKNDENDILIKVFHWGFEYNTYPMPIDIEIAHNNILNGTDLIIGHHPHVIQSKETYFGKSIYYSLGNFYFSSRRKNFLKKCFSGKISDKCNYGLGIVFDIESSKVIEEILFYYDSVCDSTKIIEGKIDNEVLSDITNEDYKKNNYIKKIISTKQNYNPILTKNKLLNIIKIYLLYLIYYLKKILKKYYKKYKKK